MEAMEEMQRMDAVDNFFDVVSSFKVRVTSKMPLFYFKRSLECDLI